MRRLLEYPASSEKHDEAMRAFYKRKRGLWARCIWYPIFGTMLTRDVQIMTRSDNAEMFGDAGLNVQNSPEEAI